jgi:hypothetical protein
MEACPLVDFNPKGHGFRRSFCCPLEYAPADSMACRGSFAFWANLPDPLTDKLFEASRRILPIRNRGRPRSRAWLKFRDACPRRVNDPLKFPIRFGWSCRSLCSVAAGGVELSRTSAHRQWSTRQSAACGQRWHANARVEGRVLQREDGQLRCDRDGGCQDNLHPSVPLHSNVLEEAA